MLVNLFDYTDNLNVKKIYQLQIFAAFKTVWLIIIKSGAGIFIPLFYSDL